ncbi:MAG TPA: molybdate ABC transporter substrate-binding protein, partial [Dehalococcoidia bacterium]|nr:molybdate ABC transporter substrate-binding protein [Dehalococcoidia bacterium]
MSGSTSGRIAVFAAASLTEAFEEMARAMADQYPGLRVTFNFAGSQELRTQLSQGARADVYATADQQQMELASDAGLIRGEPKVFARNRLVIIVPVANRAA